MIDVQLSGLNSQVGGYHVHAMPVDTESGLGFGAECASTGGHWNPYDAPDKNCNVQNSQTQACEAGDLSGKYGSLAGKDMIDDQFTDMVLSLYDPSIIGLSVTLHREDGSRLACSSITTAMEPPSLVSTTTTTTIRTTTLKTTTTSNSDGAPATQPRVLYQFYSPPNHLVCRVQPISLTQTQPLSQ